MSNDMLRVYIIIKFSDRRENPIHVLNAGGNFQLSVYHILEICLLNINMMLLFYKIIKDKMSLAGITDPNDPYATIDTSGGYQSFVKVVESDGSDDFMELPVEKDGTLLLSTLNAQFPDAIGLKYKSASGNWGGIRSENNIMNPPNGGWGEHLYYISGEFVCFVFFLFTTKL